MVTMRQTQAFTSDEKTWQKISHSLLGFSLFSSVVAAFVASHQVTTYSYADAAVASETTPTPTPDTSSTSTSSSPLPGQVETSLPTYRASHVAQQDGTAGKPIWVTYDHGVYDITTFLAQHPGGRDKILLAAGQSIAPFWKLFAAHHHHQVYAILAELRIGNLHAEDVRTMPVDDANSTTDGKGGPYANEPTDRSPVLKINAQEPFNAEPPSPLLMESFLTPNALFFVRNHLPVPSIPDASTYALSLSLQDDASTTMSLSLADLKAQFPIVTITSTIQCAGNRRAEMSAVKPVHGLSWDKTAIGTAEWTGFRLCDVLTWMGVTETSGAHVTFEGLDVGVDGKGYGASIPLSTALDPRKEVLLAFAMNGDTLPRDHGYPLRLIVPGTVGARQVKYLGAIRISHAESPSFWQASDYKGFPPNVDYTTDNYAAWAGPSIQELPVTSAITTPVQGSVLTQEDGQGLTITGYAWSGGGRGIVRVDVSLDGGRSWKVATLDAQGTDQPYNRAWAWTPWELVVEGSEWLDATTASSSNSSNSSRTSLDIRSKAVDASYNSQPDLISPIWNMRGVLNNSHCRVQVTVVQETEQEQEEEADADTKES